MKYKNSEIETLMEKNFLNGKDLNYGCYVGQSRSAREIAIELLGIEEVARMQDYQIENWFKAEGLIPMCINLDNRCDTEMVYLVPIKELDKFKVLSR